MDLTPREKLTFVASLFNGGGPDDQGITRDGMARVLADAFKTSGVKVDPAALSDVVDSVFATVTTKSDRGDRGGGETDAPGVQPRRRKGRGGS